MDRYGASTRGFEFADGSDYPHHGGPLDRDDSYNRGYGRGASMREQGPLRGERCGRDHRLGISDDDDSDLGESDRPTGRRLSDRRGAASYVSDASIGESEYEPRDRYRRRAGGARGDGSRHHGLSPDTLDSDDSDDSDDNDSDSESPATRDGHRGPVLRRAEPLRSDLRFNGEHSEDDSDFGPRRGEHGPARRRAMAAAYAGRRGSAGTSSTDDESEDGLSAFRRGTRDRLHRLCQQDDSLDDDDDLDDSEDDEMRGARRAAPGYGWSSGRY